MSVQGQVTRGDLTEAVGRSIDAGHLNMRLQDDGGVAWYFDTVDYSIPGRILIEGSTDYAYDQGVTITLAVVSVVSDAGDSLIAEVQR